MGTARLSCASLQALLNAPAYHIAAVVTQPDRPRGRELRLQPSPVKEVALRAGLPIFQPERARDEGLARDLKPIAPELIVVAAYGQILSQSLLDLPRFGCLNVHTSLLPKYRGAAPIQWALLSDEPETGVTVMKMDAGMDTGEILTQERTSIRAEDTSETLHDRLAAMGADLLMRTIPNLVAGRIQPRPQDAAEVSYAPKIKKDDGRIDWTHTARAIWSRVRALIPWPGAFTFLPGQPRPRLLKVWQAEVADVSGPPGELLRADKEGILVGCGQQALRILRLQLEGGRHLTPQEFLSGHRLAQGQHLH